MICLNHFVLIAVCSEEFLVACLRIWTDLKGVSFREAHLWEHFGRTDKIALVTCLKRSNVPGAFLSFVREFHLIKRRRLWPSHLVFMTGAASRGIAKLSTPVCKPSRWGILRTWQQSLFCRAWRERLLRMPPCKWFLHTTYHPESFGLLGILALYGGLTAGPSRKTRFSQTKWGQTFHFGESSRGNTKGNRIESLWEGNLPLRGSLTAPLKTS